MAPYNRESTLSFLPQTLYRSEITETKNYKTELCKFYQKGAKCKYGDKCSYAHGKDELRAYKAEELQSRGVIKNAKFYRTRLCLTWVSTGSCPFNDRCQCVHDPRAKGSTSYWLPHLMKPRIIPSFTSQVDDIYHLQLSSAFNNSPFGHEGNKWIDFYKSLCNLPVTQVNRIPQKIKAKITLSMQYNQARREHYTFKPDFLVFGKPCMILQTKSFLLDQGKVTEITIQQYYALRDDQDKSAILARELAFGPLGDNSACRGIYFDIPTKAIMTYDSKSKHLNEKLDRSSSGIGFMPESPFYIMETLDDDAYQLNKDVLHFYVMHGNSFDYLNNDSRAIYASLKSRFESMMLNYSTLSWPSNANGHGPLGVPEVNTLYDFDGFKTEKLWKSFINVMCDSDHDEDCRSNKFVDLKQENSSSCFFNINDSFKTNSSSKESESCWKSLLLESSVNSEWEVLRSHYTRKVM